MRFKAH